MSVFAGLGAAIAASEWFIPTVVTTAAVVAGQLAAIPGHIKPGYSTPESHVVRVFLGMSDQLGGSDAAGAPPFIDLYDDKGQRIGSDYSKKEPIPEGSFQDYVIKPKKDHNNRRATYVRLTAAHNDGVCVSGITLVYPEGGKALIFGDIPHRTCGWPGFASMAQIEATDKSDVMPACIWLDNNNSYNFLPMAASFHIPDFSGQNRTLEAYHNNTDLICKSAPKMYRWYPKKGNRPGRNTRIPIFYPPLKYGHDGGYDNGTINHLDPELVLDKLQGNGWPASWTEKDYVADAGDLARFDNVTWDLSQQVSSDIDGQTHTRRNLHGRVNHEQLAAKKLRAEHHKRRFGDQFVMTNRSSWHNTATAVCSNEGSWGPHWANSHEQKFCNVADLAVWPFCSTDHNETGCFDAEAQQLRTPTPPALGNMLGAIPVAAVAATTSVLNLTLRGFQG